MTEKKEIPQPRCFVTDVAFRKGNVGGYEHGVVLQLEFIEAGSPDTRGLDTHHVVEYWIPPTREISNAIDGAGKQLQLQADRHDQAHTRPMMPGDPCLRKDEKDG